MFSLENILRNGGTLKTILQFLLYLCKTLRKNKQGAKSAVKFARAKIR